MRPRRWRWFGLVVELAKPVVGAIHGSLYAMECLDSCARGIYNDLIAHYQWLCSQDDFALQVMQDLEQLPES